jgi:nucleoside-diphosphate-sugar epimerase
MDRSVFVTGATGVIGRRVVPQLVALGHRVTAIGRGAEKRAWLETAGARAVALDLVDAGALQQALAGQDVVINLATHMPSSTFKMMLPWSWKENDRVRREGSAALADAALAAGVSRFIQESFAPVYEGGGERWIDETWPMRPAPYNRTVLDAERSAERFTAGGGTGLVLRFAAFYGPDPFLREMIGVVRRGWAPLPGPRGAYWSSVGHDDAAAAVVAALGIPAGIYNVCDDDPVTREEFADVMAAAARLQAKPRPMPRWMTALGGKTIELLSRSQRMSNRKLKGATGWAPSWSSVREGMPAAVNALT